MGKLPRDAGPEVGAAAATTAAEAGAQGRLARLEAAVAELAARVESLEATGAARGAARLPDPATVAAPAPALPSLEPLRGVPALAGRTLVVLGGAFLVRSLAESGILTAAVGVAVGIAYALVWLLLADRHAARGSTASGTFHALASALIVYPLLLEAPTRLALLSAPAAALLLVAANVAGLMVAWRNDFRAVAWIQQIAALAVGLLLLFRTRSPWPFVLALLALAAASLILAYGRGWRGQRWLVAIGVDVVAAMLGGLVLVGRGPSWLDPRAVLFFQLGLVTIYLGAFVLRLLVQARFVTPFAIAQTVVVLGLGFEGALAVGGPAVRRMVAIAALVVGGVLHGVLARRSERRSGHGPAVGYFSSVATFLAAEGVRVLAPAPAAALLWLVAAAVLAALALGGSRPILEVHAALLATAGALLSGLVAAAVAALAAPAAAPWPPFDPPALVALGLVASTAVLLLGRAPANRRARWARWARLAVATVALAGAGGWLVRLVGATLAGAPGATAEAGTLAAVRSAVLAAAAIGLAAAAAAARRGELAQLAWLVLAAGGLKLALEDLRLDGAGHLVFSLVLYGAALIAVPALVRRLRRGPVPTSPVPASP